MRGTGYLLSWYFYWHFHQDNHPHQMKNQINIFSLKRVQKNTGGVLILTSEIYAAAYAQRNYRHFHGRIIHRGVVLEHKVVTILCSDGT